MSASEKLKEKNLFCTDHRWHVPYKKTWASSCISMAFQGLASTMALSLDSQLHQELLTGTTRTCGSSIRVQSKKKFNMQLRYKLPSSEL